MRCRAAAWGLLAGAAGVTPCASDAIASETRGYLEQAVRAPSDTWELTDTFGYAQGFGMMAPGRGLAQVAGPGLEVRVEGAYRWRPALSLGAEVEYQEFKYQPQKSRAVAVDAGATYHLRPYWRTDPWIRMGTGYRWLWELDVNGRDGATVLRQGFQLATVKIGCDLRVYDELAVAAFVGADVNLFVWEEPPGGPSFAMSSAQIGAFFHAGVTARFSRIRD
jgi:hypothetical protein